MPNSEIQTFYTKKLSSYSGNVKTQALAKNDINEHELIENIKNKKKYDKIDNLGRGGMGHIALSRDNSCLRDVAIKTLHNELLGDSEAVIRFTEEAQITAQLEHPNIIPVYELSVNASQEPFYTMKHIDGENLRDILTEIKKENKIYLKQYPYTRLIRILLKVCHAMSYACSRGVLHRDLKPENIMVGQYGEVTLVDWGLAKVMDNTYPPDTVTEKRMENFNFDDQVDSLRLRNSLNLSLHNTLVGTPEFMSPERIFGHADERSEVYSLGAILYSILTLENPYRETELKDLIRKVSKGNYRPLEDFNNLPHLPNKNISGSLLSITQKAMQLEADDRYQSIKEFREDLEAYLNGYAPNAEEVSLFKAVQLLMKRHYKLVLTITVLIVILLISSATFISELIANQRKAEIESAIAQELEREAQKKAILVEEKSQELQKRINELSKSAPVLYENALTFLNRLEPRQAIVSLKNALKLKPDLHEAIYLKGSINMALGKFTAGIRSFTQAIIKRPDLQKDLELSKKLLRMTEEYMLDTGYKELFNHFLHTKRIPQALLVLENLKSLSNYDALLLDTWTKQLRTSSLEKLLEDEKQFSMEVEQGKFHVKISSPGDYDFSALSSMPVVSLELYGVNLNNLNSFKNMPLEHLSITDCKVNSLEPLKEKNLKSLYISNTPIDTLTDVKHMPIKNLDISGTKIKSLINTTNMPLQFLNISNTGIDNIQHLKNQKLYSFVAENTQLKDISALINMPLIRLNLKRVPLESLNGIETLKQLKFLNLSYTGIDSLSQLRNLKHLKHLSILDTPIRNLDGLENKKIPSFIASYTNIESLESLKGQPLTEVFLTNTHVKDLSPIASSSLQELTINDSPSVDFSTLKEATSLKHLVLNDCNLKNLFFIKNMHQLRFLSASSNQIKSTAPFETLNKLQYLNLLNFPQNPFSRSRRPC